MVACGGWAHFTTTFTEDVTRSVTKNPGRRLRGLRRRSFHAASYRFPLRQAATAASLALTGDTIAQLHQRWVRNKDTLSRSEDFKDTASSLLSEHDWIRSLRMTSYGFLLYGPGSYAWYQLLDHCMPKQNVQNLMMKVS
ncbi:UNVERIFIED_CONTAM: hypothetical protein Sradi_6094400 [Sesamum radiatum]|uniref:Uncharacterized protein n=1 Tax=Sesamum radiatum TaxID=300843 RepID=A0AAW2KKM5_SESRA